MQHHWVRFTERSGSIRFGTLEGERVRLWHGNMFEYPQRGDRTMALDDVRLRLHSVYAGVAHDWASLVTYAVFPPNIDEQLEDTRYHRARRALDVALGSLDIELAAHAKLLLEQSSNLLPVAQMRAMKASLFDCLDDAMKLIPSTGRHAGEGLGLLAAAEKRRINVIMELLNSKVNHKDYMCDRTPWGVELVKRVGSERFKLLYDIYHMQIMEGDVIRTIKDNAAYIGHYHTAGNPGRNEFEPQDQQELNYPPIMRAIKATGFKGFVGQEFQPKRDPLTSLREAVKICAV
jgi:hypothetical protein